MSNNGLEKLGDEMVSNNNVTSSIDSMGSVSSSGSDFISPVEFDIMGKNAPSSTIESGKMPSGKGEFVSPCDTGY